MRDYDVVRLFELIQDVANIADYFDFRFGQERANKIIG